MQIDGAPQWLVGTQRMREGAREFRECRLKDIKTVHAHVCVCGHGVVWSGVVWRGVVHGVWCGVLWCVLVCGVGWVGA